MRARAISTSAARSTSWPSAWTNIRTFPAKICDYAGADAKAFAEAMEKGSGPLYEGW